MQKQQNENASTDEQPYIKSPVSACVLWSRDQRRKNPLKYQNIHIKEMSKRLDAEWNQLSVEEKQPFIDEANKLEEQHTRDHPDYQFRPPLRPKSVLKTFDKTVVPYGMSSSFPPLFNAKELEFMSKFLFPGYVTENRSNSLTGRIPTRDMHSTTYPAISYDSITQPTQWPSYISMTAHNAVTQQADSPFQYKFTNLGRKDSTQEMNPSDSVQSNTISSSLVEHSCPEPQHRNEESPLHLSVRKDKYSSKSFPPVFNAKEFEFMSNRLVPGYVTENKSISLTGRIPTRDMHSTTYPAISYDSITQPTEWPTYISMTAQNAVTQQADSPFQYKFTYLGRKDSTQEMNPRDSVQSNTISSSLVEHSCPEPQHRNEESLLHLSVRKDK